MKLKRYNLDTLDKYKIVTISVKISTSFYKKRNQIVKTFLLKNYKAYNLITTMSEGSTPLLDYCYTAYGYEFYSDLTCISLENKYKLPEVESLFYKVKYKTFIKLLWKKIRKRALTNLIIKSCQQQSHTHYLRFSLDIYPK